MGHLPPTILHVGKTRINVLSCGIKNLGRTFFHFVTINAFVRRTDRWTAFSRLVRACIAAARKNERGKDTEAV